MAVCEAREDGVAVRVKAVPGASRSRIAGVLGDHLKVQLAAPPEDGRANAALCDLLAQALGLPPRDVAVVAGHARARKIVLVRGRDAADVEARLCP